MTIPQASSRDCFAAVNGLRLHCLDRGGEGRPVLLILHGLSGHAHTFDLVAPRFADRFHTLSLDVRGRGESEWAAETATTAFRPTSPTSRACRRLWAWTASRWWAG